MSHGRQASMWVVGVAIVVGTSGISRAQSAPVAPAPAVAAAPAAASAGTLDGIWMFDAQHSDDPMKVMQASHPDRGAEGGRGGGGWGGGGGGGWGGGGHRHGGGARMGGGGPEDGGGPDSEHAAGERPAGPNPMERVMRPAKKVVIEQLADEVRVSEDERAARGYAVEDSLKAHDRDLVTEAGTAKWHGDRLEMKQTLGRRGALVETYVLSKDGRTLTIQARREGGMSGMPNPTFTRVYTRYEGD